MKKLLQLLVLVFLWASGLPALNFARSPQVVLIKAHIDGRSRLILKANTAQWKHFEYAAPGRHEFIEEPTIFNEVSWFPEWPDIPNRENRNCTCTSTVFTGVPVSLPQTSASVKLTNVQSRGQTKIVQEPAPENDFTLIVEFDDNLPGGSQDYIVELTYVESGDSEWSLESDSLALVALFNSENGTGWAEEHRTNWLIGPVSTWSGVVVESGRVTELNLEGYGLHGELPQELTNLSALEVLDLSSNEFGNKPIPTWIGNLSKLRRLDLWFCGFAGQIPPELGQLSNLEVLNLADNSLYGPIPRELGQLVNLRVLFVSRNGISHLPAELGNLSKLEVLDLDRTLLEQAVPLSFVNMTSLGIFRFFGTILCGPDHPDFWTWYRSIPREQESGDLSACTDDVPPECRVIEFVRKSHIKVLVQDGLDQMSQTQQQTGLLEVRILKSTNAEVTIDPFYEGATTPVYVTATKNNPTRPSVLELLVTDASGNDVTCDPVLTTLTAEVPEDFLLDQNYPNPFNPATTIRFQVPEQVMVTLEVFDLLGQRVVKLVDEEVLPGTHAVEWDGRNESGAPVAGGTYLYRIRAGSFIQTSLMTLLK